MMSRALIFILCSFVTILCHVAAKEVWHHKLPYQSGDRQPHFGYVKSHLASDHKKRHHAPNKTSVPNPSDDIQLNNYVAKLYVGEELKCAGLVVSNRTVLTSNMCLHNVPLKKIKLKLMDGTVHEVINATDGDDYTYNIATKLVSRLTLAKELPKLYTIPPPICPVLVDKSDEVVLWSWDKHKKSLKKKSAPQLDLSECKQLIHASWSELIDSAFSCVENTHITEKCENTYGLPYVWKGHFCGLNILGHNCVTTADVYARLLQVKSYISRKLNEVRISKLEEDII